MNPTQQSILDRIKPEGGGEPLRAAVTSAFAIADKLKSKTSEIRTDATLSADGRKLAISKLLPSQIQDFIDATAAIRQAEATLAERSAALKKTPKLDKSDLVGELRRMRIQDYVSALPAGDRLKFVTDNIADLEFCVAILSAPVRGLAGLSSEQFEVFRTAYLETHFGDHIRDLSVMRDAVENAVAAIAVARQDMQKSSGTTEYEFDKIAGPIEESQATKKADGSEMLELSDSDRRLLEAAKQGRIEAYARRELWAVESYARDPEGFLSLT